MDKPWVILGQISILMNFSWETAMHSTLHQWKQANGILRILSTSGPFSRKNREIVKIGNLKFFNSTDYDSRKKLAKSDAQFLKKNVKNLHFLSFLPKFRPNLG